MLKVLSPASWSAALLSCVLVVPTVSFAASVYKWVDANGVVHYTDQKPANQSAEQMMIQTGHGAATSSPEGDVNALDRQKELKDLGQRQAQESADEKQHRKEVCDTARKNLETIKNNARIKIDDNGTQRFLTPEEILSKRDHYDKLVKENCQ